MHPIQSIPISSLLLATLVALTVAAPPSKPDVKPFYQEDPKGFRIKLSRKHPTEDSPETILYGRISLGNTFGANQFNVVLDSSSDILWVPKVKTWPIINDELHYGQGYDSSLSSESQQIGDQTRFLFRQIELRGTLYEDRLNLYADTDEIIASSPTLSVNYNFSVVDWANSTDYKNKPFDGFLGLAPGKRAKDNLLVAIRNQLIDIHRKIDPDYVPDPGACLLMGLWINPDREATFGGELVLGGFDSTRVVYPITYHKMNSKERWQLALKRMQIGRSDASCRQGCNAIFDTGNDSLVGPAEDVRFISQALGTNYSPELDLWIVPDCKIILGQMPPLNFWLAVDDTEEVSYTLKPEDYVSKFMFKGIETCYLTIKPGKGKDWILGTSFLQNFYTVFDIPTGQIGFARPRKN